MIFQIRQENNTIDQFFSHMPLTTPNHNSMGTTEETVIRRLFPKQELIWENESHTLEHPKIGTLHPMTLKSIRLYSREILIKTFLSDN